MGEQRFWCGVRHWEQGLGKGWGRGGSGEYIAAVVHSTDLPLLPMGTGPWALRGLGWVSMQAGLLLISAGSHLQHLLSAVAEAQPGSYNPDSALQGCL